MLWMQYCKDIICLRLYFAHMEGMPLQSCRLLHVPVIHSRVWVKAKREGGAGETHYSYRSLRVAATSSKPLKSLRSSRAGCLQPVRRCHAPLTQCYVQPLQYRLPRLSEAAQALLAPDLATSAGKQGLARHWPVLACRWCDLSFDRGMLTRSCCMWARRRHCLGYTPCQSGFFA